MRTFLAIPIPDAHADALAAIARRLPPGREVAPELMHITALFLGDPPDAALEDLNDAILAARFELPPLTIAGLGHFGRAAPRVVWAGVEPAAPLIDLNGRLARRAHGSGIQVERQRYVPHITLCRYGVDGVTPGELATTFARIGRVALDEFQPTELTLTASHLGPKGPKYEPLASYPIKPA